MTLTKEERQESYRRRGALISAAKKGIFTESMRAATVATGEKARGKPKRKCVDGCTCRKHNQTPGRYVSCRGYVILTTLAHPLSNKPPGITGNVPEHRYVLWNKLGCESLDCEHPCHWCGTPLKWSILKADHVDFDTLNNAPENLVPACNRCNVTRSLRRKKGATT